MQTISAAPESALAYRSVRRPGVKSKLRRKAEQDLAEVQAAKREHLGDPDAVAKAMELAAEMSPQQRVLVCLSGRGDKDAAEVARLRNR